MHSTRINQKLILWILRTKKKNTSPVTPTLPSLTPYTHRAYQASPSLANATAAECELPSTATRFFEIKASLSWSCRPWTSETTTLTCSGSTIIVNIRFINIAVIKYSKDVYLWRQTKDKQFMHSSPGRLLYIATSCRLKGSLRYQSNRKILVVWNL